MNINQLAKTILDMREERMSAFIQPGHLIEQIGTEGYAEALRRRWLVGAEEAEGLMTVTNQLGIVNEMRELASECACEEKEEDDEKAGEETSEMEREERKRAQGGHDRARADFHESASRIAINHANRPRVLHELAIGQPNQDLSGSSATPQKQADPQVGNDVVVAAEGQTYPAKVASREPDGTYRLSFGQKKPGIEKKYRKEELRLVKPGETV